MSLSMHIMCPSTGGHEEAVISWRDTMLSPWEITIDDTTEGEDAGFLRKCDRMWRTSDADVIAYLHSDMFLLEHGWDVRVLHEFEDPQVTVVGVVGATELGRDELYKVPYHFTQLARAHVYSNLVDAEVHGIRETQSRQVAVLDSCAIFVRSQFLSRIGGWPCDSYPNSSHCSDLWLCCMAARHGLRVHMVGIKAQHKSGGKGQVGTEWLDARGGDHMMHQAAHVATYNQFRDVLPIHVRS